MKNVNKAVAGALSFYAVVAIPQRWHFSVNWRLLPRKVHDNALSSYSIDSETVIWK